MSGKAEGVTIAGQVQTRRCEYKNVLTYIFLHASGGYGLYRLFTSSYARTSIFGNFNYQYMFKIMIAMKMI